MATWSQRRAGTRGKAPTNGGPKSLEELAAQATRSRRLQERAVVGWRLDAAHQEPPLGKAAQGLVAERCKGVGEVAENRVGYPVLRLKAIKAEQESGGGGG